MVSACQQRWRKRKHHWTQELLSCWQSVSTPNLQLSTGLFVALATKHGPPPQTSPHTQENTISLNKKLNLVFTEIHETHTTSHTCTFTCSHTGPGFTRGSMWMTQVMLPPCCVATQLKRPKHFFILLYAHIYTHTHTQLHYSSPAALLFNKDDHSCATSADVLWIRSVLFSQQRHSCTMSGLSVCVWRVLTWILTEEQEKGRRGWCRVETYISNIIQ